VVAVEGASAAGKTTATETAARKRGWTVVPEAYRRLVPTPSLDYRSPAGLLRLERSLLEEDARRFAEARARARAGATVLADTGFLGPLTYTWALLRTGAAPPSVLASLVEFAHALHDRGAWGLADAYVYLDTPPALRSARARSDRAGHPATVAARHAAVGALERQFSRERFAPLLGSRFRWVTGRGPVALVAGRVQDAVERFEGPSLRPGPVAAVLALFEGRRRGTPPSRGNR
jgi:hypothetical protein